MIAARTGHPTPAIVDRHPAAVVRRCKTPGRIVDPGPTPRILPYPMAIAIWCPIGSDVARVPHVAIVLLRTPTAVFVEIVCADDIAADILQGCAVLCTRVA